MLIHQRLDRTAERIPDKSAVISRTESISYYELQRYSLRLAEWLALQGVCRGDRIVLQLPSSVPLVGLIVAASRIGAIFVPVHEETKQGNLEHILMDAEPKIWITANTQTLEPSVPLQSIKSYTIQDIREAATQCAGDELTGETYAGSLPACLIYTSGSTGKPKAIVSTHDNIAFSTDAIQQCLQYRENDVIGNFLPLSFDYGLYQVFLAFNVGAAVALGSPADTGPYIVQRLSAWKVTCLPALPNLFHSLLTMGRRDASSLSALRMITNTGARLPDSYIMGMKQMLPDCLIYVMYGLTECKRVSILDPADYSRKSKSVGKPLPGTACYIVDEQHSIVPFGTVGQLVVKGPHVTPGYWNSPDQTDRSFRMWGTEGERCLFTGDQCSMDEEGYLYFHGRNDDIYKQNGFRVSAIEVEQAAGSIPGVTRTALIPPEGEEKATLILSSTLTVADIRERLSDLLEGYKMPEHIVLLEQFPITGNGKYDKKKLRDWIEGVKHGL
ncbi:acyl-CoA synthetase (AMP-forming)/AMP-acid ligase II [Paenibacillus cellulosilyticus]|uniref:Acyl-CoA synthetase (AMP-forming)/AMP-acid ligase II n=1 Tax=Paenibacillus cellulosilyticus TaxID=375489 RepID=A0A2V2YWM2_9BACL|nr:class I adenylate-forming enzyme family protein [Paenibacillus cellulosilyticus]PWW06132.1 acyl-CoA synthetase (AMP-forming)/AMP-acid ligase II [Paenibacillus cellulosilyticus]QKS43097.1 acyl--CoA ligase [Paenibacillus cellulosilyticus]